MSKYDEHIPILRMELGMPAIRLSICRALMEQVDYQAEEIKDFIKKECEQIDMAQLIQAEIRKQLPAIVQSEVANAIKYNSGLEKYLGKVIEASILDERDKLQAWINGEGQ